MPAHDRNKGIPLNEASYYFAPPRLRAQYDEPTLPAPRRGRGFQILANELARSKTSNRQSLLTSFEASQRFADLIQAQSAIEAQMRERLLDAFGRGKLVAYGILWPRTRNSVLEKVPDDLLQHQFINWGKSSIKQQDFEYVSVRVFRPEWTTDLEKRSLQAKPRPIGRPSSKQAITEAIRALLDEGQIPTKSRKKDYEIISDRTAQMYPNEFLDNKGLSDKTIAKYLAIELRAHPAKRSPKP
jgi:hypothetical protein